MSFELFRTREANSNSCVSNYEASFITNGASATTIYSLRLDVDKKAALVLTDKDGPDTAVVFTYKERHKNDELLKGDYFSWDNKTYLVVEDVAIVHQVEYKKQKCYQCNVGFEYNDKCYYGYYVGSLARYVDTILQKDLNIEDKEKPILVLPLVDWIAVGVKLMINGKPFKIIDFDAITNDGIVYCSLDRDFADKEETIDPEPEPEPPEPQVPTLQAGIPLDIETAYGYFKTSIKVDIIQKTLTKVQYMIPYDTEEITITTKDENKMDIVTTYKVVNI